MCVYTVRAEASAADRANLGLCRLNLNEGQKAEKVSFCLLVYISHISMLAFADDPNRNE